MQGKEKNRNVYNPGPKGRFSRRPLGKPRLADFRLEKTAVPAPGPQQILLRVQYLSLDPYMRGRMDDRESYAQPTPVGGVMPGESVASPTCTLSSPPIASPSCGATTPSLLSATIPAHRSRATR